MLYVFCWFIFYENELNLVIMCPLETGFGELDGSYIITLLGNPAIGVEKSLEMESMLNEIQLNIFNHYKLDSLIPSLSFTHTHAYMYIFLCISAFLFWYIDECYFLEDSSIIRLLKPLNYCKIKTIKCRMLSSRDIRTSS